jgi:hypothetical protein
VLSLRWPDDSVRRREALAEAFDDEQTVAGWATPAEFAAVAAEGVAAVEASGLSHEVPAHVAAALGRLAARLPDPSPRAD